MTLGDMDIWVNGGWVTSCTASASFGVVSHFIFSAVLQLKDNEYVPLVNG